jgi:radical SAM protein with 4Fe4S-binding SPASM domain
MTFAKLRRFHFPTHLFIEPTTQCNLKCLHCGRTYWKERDQYRDMDLEMFKSLVSEAAELGVNAITIQGLGEPLLHPQIFEMVNHAQQAGIFTRFNTNFTIMDAEKAENLVKSRHGEVTVSIESVDPDMYADIRRKGTLDTVLSNMRLLADTKKRLGMDTPKIRVNAVLMYSTMDHIETLVETLKNLGVSEINFQGLNTEGIPEKARLKDGTLMSKNALASLSDQEIENIINRIKALDCPECHVSTHWDLGGRHSQNIPKDFIRTCREMWERPYVDSNGHVTPCCLIPDGSIMSLGNLNEQSFKDIWAGDAYNTLRRQHLTGNPPKACVNCQAMNYIFDVKSGDFIEHGSGERLSGYFSPTKR